MISASRDFLDKPRHPAGLFFCLLLPDRLQSNRAMFSS